MNRTLITRLAGLAGILALLAYTGWRLYDLGKLRGVSELQALRTENATLERQNKELAADAEDLRERVAILERSSQIDREAAQSVKADLGQLEEELQATREEVEFYRGIVAPGDVNPGLHIHRFTLEHGKAAGEYHFDLVLTQLKRNDQYVSGEVDWKIAGRIAGERGALTLVDVTRPATQHLKFRFRYFQDLAGTITLPGDFEAERVVLTIRPEGKGKQEPVVQQFDWP
ncbi:MAG: DUF6776 family protein [Pseudomonadota bacterium]